MEDLLLELEKENKRHEKNIDRIREKLGIRNTIILHDKMETDLVKYREMKDSLMELFWDIVEKISKRKRFSFGKDYTFRKGTLFKYDTSSQLSLKQICQFLNNYDLKRIIQKKYRDDIEKAISRLVEGHDNIINIDDYKTGEKLEEGDKYYLLYTPSKSGISIENEIKFYKKSNNGKKRAKEDKKAPSPKPDLELSIMSKEKEKISVIAKESQAVNRCLEKGYEDVKESKMAVVESHEILCDRFKKLLAARKI